MSGEAIVEIVEEPEANLSRFRHLCEGTSGTVFGVNTTEEKRTYPAIKILNYTGRGSVIVSCVTNDIPHRPHPHELVGKNCARGVCYIANFTTDSDKPSVLYFPNMRIQCTRSSEIEAKLNDRQVLRIDPFGNGLEYIHDVRRSLNSVRLCFQVIISPDPTNPTHRIQLEPKVTRPIYIINQEELIINEISDTSSPKCGGKNIVIFCTKISREDIRVRFFQKSGENEIWEDWGTQLNIHRNFGITFMTPRYEHQHHYRDINIVVNVFVQLVRPSDAVRSEPIPFQYIPDVTDMTSIMMKRNKSKIKKSEQLFQRLGEIPKLNIPSTPVQGNPQHQHQPEKQPTV